MHYHSPQHGELGLRPTPSPPIYVEIRLPSTTSLPAPPLPPQNPSEAQGSHLDRMQAEVIALQQQAQATQNSLKALQTRDSTSPYSAIVSDLPGFLSGANSTMLGVGSALALAAVVVWWVVWRRPQTRWIDAPRAAAQTDSPISTRVPLSERVVSLHSPSSTQPPVLEQQDDALALDPNTESGDTTQPYESGHSPFTRHMPSREFDPEAAASEVTRVRKFLAAKREARANLQDRDDSGYAELDLNLDLAEEPLSSGNQTPSVRAWLDNGMANNAFEIPEPTSTPISDSELDLDLGTWQTPEQLAPIPEPVVTVDDGISFSLVEEAVDTVQPDPELEPQPDPNPFLDLVSEHLPEAIPETETALAPTPMPDLEPPFGAAPETHASGSKGYDFTITLALAQESAALELWNEARDLASEVLESDDPKLVSEALSLLERLNQAELQVPVDVPPGTSAR